MSGFRESLFITTKAAKAVTMLMPWETEIPDRMNPLTSSPLKNSTPNLSIE